MSNKKFSKTVKRRLTFLGPIVIAIFVICTFTIITYFYKIQALENEKIKLSNELEELIREEERLSSEISKLKDPDYIAKYARENYYYTKDGEYVIKIEEKERIDVKNSADADKPFYILAFVITILTFIVFYLRKIAKKRSK